MMAKAKPIQGLNANATTGVNARMIALARLAELYEWARYVGDPTRVQELHNMRIATKRLRYTLEIFEEALPVAVSPIVEELTRVQDELGEIHDSDVRLKLLHLAIDAEALSSGQTERAVEVNEELVDYLLAPDAAPSDEARDGLKRFINTVLHAREEQYHAFQLHWQQLQKRSFYDEVQSLLAT